MLQSLMTLITMRESGKVVHTAAHKGHLSLDGRRGGDIGLAAGCIPADPTDQKKLWFKLKFSLGDEHNSASAFELLKCYCLKNSLC